MIITPATISVLPLLAYHRLKGISISAYVFNIDLYSFIIGETDGGEVTVSGSKGMDSDTKFISTVSALP